MSNTVYQICRICGLPDGVDVKSSDDNECWMVRCPTCGDFTITQSVIDSGLHQTIRHKFSAWTRAKKESGQAAPLISQDTFDAIVSSFPNYSIADKQRLLIQTLAEQTSHPGESVYLNYRSLWPRVWASGSDEVYNLANALHDRRLIAFTQKSGDQTIDHCQITPAGWGYLDKIENRTLDSSQTFVAMRFDPSMDSAWIDGIKPALERAGYMPYRVDNDVSHLGRIDARIEMEIKRSRFLVADVTGGRQGVYYEAGYAMGYLSPMDFEERHARQVA